MDDETRKRVDAACLRLLGWQLEDWWPETQQWRAFPPGGSIRLFCSPSRDPSHVVPLAEALVAKGWNYEMRSFTDAVTGRSIRIVHLTLPAGSAPPHGRHAYGEADTLPLALALAAAQAVGEEPTE